MDSMTILFILFALFILFVFFRIIYRFFFSSKINNTNNVNLAVNLPPTEKTNYGGSKLADLERLAKLREQGHISDAEFEVQKRNLLG